MWPSATNTYFYKAVFTTVRDSEIVVFNYISTNTIINFSKSIAQVKLSLYMTQGNSIGLHLLFICTSVCREMCKTL